MSRIFQGILKTGLLCIVLLLGLLTAFVLFFDANSLKPLIINRVYKMTGYELVLDGPLSWSFFPMFGLTTGHWGLKNPPGTKQLYLIEAEHARLNVRLLPLLHRTIEAGTVSIRNASVDLNDPATNRVLSINHLNASAENIQMNKDFSVRADFDYKTNAPVMTGHVSLQGSTQVNPDAKTFSLQQLLLKADVQAGIPHAVLHFKGQGVGDWQKDVYTLSDLSGTLANMPISGSLKKRGSEMAGTFQIAAFDLKKFLTQTGVGIPALQSAPKVDGTVNFSVTPAEMNISGIFNAPSIQAASLRLRQVVVPFHFANNILDIQNANCTLYDGSGSLKGMLKMQTMPWQTAVQMGLNGVQIEPLLKDLNKDSKLTVSGIANVAMILSSVGQTDANLLESLNGSINFNVKQGVLQGIDVPFYIDTARALAGSRVSPHSQGNTAFGELKGTALIHNGIVTNQDLSGNAPRFTLSGRGTINLPADKINYFLQVYLNKPSADFHDDLSTLFGLPVPLEVSGSLQSPQVSFDKEAFLKALAKQQIQKAANKIITKELKGKIPDNAGKVLNQLLGQ